MRIKITRCTVAGQPAQIRGVGEILTVPELEARELVRMGKAERVALEPVADVATDPRATAEPAAPIAQHADPTPRRRR